MTTNELKQLLAKKLQQEGTYFTTSHIRARKIRNGFKIVIEDYEHIPFKLLTEYSDSCYLTTVYAGSSLIYFFDSQRRFVEHDAINVLGYYIGTRF